MSQTPTPGFDNLRRARADVDLQVAAALGELDTLDAMLPGDGSLGDGALGLRARTHGWSRAEALQGGARRSSTRA
jgi:hypothetical protein